MKAFVLAGGFATRLWPLTEHRAKPLLPLAGKPIITHLVEKIPEDISVTVSTNAVFGEQFGRWALGVGRRDLKVLIEDTTHDDHKLGALGAAAQWIEREKIDDDVLLLTGDNYLGFSMDAFLGAYTNGTPLIAAYDIEDREKARHFGVVVVDGKRIKQFQEKPHEPASTLVSTGCSILPRHTLPILLEFASGHPDNVGGIFEEFLRRNISVECFIFSEPWLDIGSFASYMEAHRLIVADRKLIDRSAQCDRSTLHGGIVIGPESTVLGSELTNTMIFGHCRITDCILRECIVDEGCVIEGIDLTGKMLRGGSTLRASEKCPPAGQAGKVESGK